jgi:hypothetical protein
VLTILGNHQQLMATRGTIGPELAHLAIRVPGLEQAIVEEIPAPFDSSESMTTLRIWIGDTRYQALVPYEADPGDVQMRFLNAVLEQEGLGSRVARPTAAPGSLVFGEGEALRTLHDTWLLRLENYGDWSD